MSARVDYYFSITSPWAYLGARRLTALCERAGVAIEPILIATISQNGWVPMGEKPVVRQKYVFEDLARWAKRLSLPITLEGRSHLRNAAPAYKMPIAAALRGEDMLPLAIALQTAFWGHGEDIGDPAVRAAIATKAGYDGAALLADEEKPEVEIQFQANIARATQSGVFGSPTYKYGEQTFWGQDRLDFLEEALMKRAA
jgi:2-hydroxychromene-2-carboxylate isomerase